MSYYSEQSRKINPSQIQDVQAINLESHVLKPRQDLYLFTVYNWITGIFLPSLESDLVENLFVFGIGRIFSAYSTKGVQFCTDADLNFVVDDSISDKKTQYLRSGVVSFARRMWDLFNIIIEVDDSFTVLPVSRIKKRLADKNENSRLAATLFYKGNAESHFVLLANDAIKEEVFSSVRSLPDQLLLENFIGENPVKPTFIRLKKETAKLTVLADDIQQKESASFVIGSKTFDKQCRILHAINAELYPPDWCFSMKYSVNRVFDYVSAMQHAGYTFEEIGFSGPQDSDYTFLLQSHRLMLFLQEIIHVKLDTYNYLSDYSYITRKRFEDFMTMPKSSFRGDFDSFVLGPHFLLASERKHYLMLKQAIHEKRVLHLLLTTKQESILEETFGFDFRHRDKGSGKIPVTIPYTWGGLGFYVFKSVHNRLESLVENRLIPAASLL